MGYLFTIDMSHRYLFTIDMSQFINETVSPISSRLRLSPGTKPVFSSCSYTCIVCDGRCLQNTKILEIAFTVTLDKYDKRDAKQPDS